MPYQAVQHLNQKQDHPVLVFLMSFAQIHCLPLMQHSDYSAESLQTGYEQGCLTYYEQGYLTYYEQGYEIHFWTGCASNFLG